MGPKLRLIVIYIWYYSVVDSLQWNVESTSNLDYEGVNTSMGPSGPCSKLIQHDGMVYEGSIDFRFTLVHKGILVIIQGCIRDSEQVLQIGLID